MFRRPGKNPLDNYTEESEREARPYKYVRDEASPPPRLFDTQPYTEEKPSLVSKLQSLVKEEPETTLGEGVTFRGELAFERFLRIDGTFEGELISQGKVVVGPKGRVKANLNLREAIIEGRVEGNVVVTERLELRGEAVLHGDIQARLLSIDEGVSLIGNVTVVPHDNL